MTILNPTAQNGRRSERGNVLFLILIAVALFAALTYAVTESSRLDSDDANKKPTLVNAADITLHPSSIKTAITRMIKTNSTDPDSLLFDTPSTFSSFNTNTPQQTAFSTRQVVGQVMSPRLLA